MDSTEKSDSHQRPGRDDEPTYDPREIELEVYGLDTMPRRDATRKPAGRGRDTAYDPTNQKTPERPRRGPGVHPMKEPTPEMIAGVEATLAAMAEIATADEVDRLVVANDHANELLGGMTGTIDEIGSKADRLTNIILKGEADAIVRFVAAALPEPAVEPEPEAAP